MRVRAGAGRRAATSVDVAAPVDRETGFDLRSRSHDGDELPTDARPQRVDRDDVARVRYGDYRSAELPGYRYHTVLSGDLRRQDRCRRGVDRETVKVDELEVVFAREQADRVDFSHELTIGTSRSAIDPDSAAWRPPEPPSSDSRAIPDVGYHAPVSARRVKDFTLRRPMEDAQRPEPIWGRAMFRVRNMTPPPPTANDPVANRRCGSLVSG